MSFELKFYFRSLLIGAVNEEMTMTDKETIRNDLEIARRLLQQMQDHFDKIETKVSRGNDAVL